MLMSMSMMRFIAPSLILIMVSIACSTSSGAVASARTTTETPASNNPPTVTTTPGNSTTKLPTAVAPNGGSLFVLSPNSSEARYKVREQLAERSLPGDAIGATKGVLGSIVIG